MSPETPTQNGNALDARMMDVEVRLTMFEVLTTSMSRSLADADVHLRWLIAHVHTLYAVLLVQVVVNVLLLSYIIWLEWTR